MKIPKFKNSNATFWVIVFSIYKFKQRLRHERCERLERLEKTKRLERFIRFERFEMFNRFKSFEMKGLKGLIWKIDSYSLSSYVMKRVSMNFSQMCGTKAMMQLKIIPNGIQWNVCIVQLLLLMQSSLSIRVASILVPAWTQHLSEILFF